MSWQKPPKRIRGVEKELSLKNPCQKDSMEEEESTSSPLCNRLLQLWAQGRLSATQVAEIAHLTMLEGCANKEILKLAKCGTFGENKGNCHRDMVAYCCQAMRMPEPLLIQVPMQDCKWQKETTADAAILLPHLLFSKLSENYVDSFENLFCLPECQAFWKGVQEVQDPRVAEPLAKSGVIQSPEKTIPLFIHGDGCEFQNGDSLMTWSWGSLLAKHPSLSAHLLIAAIPKSCTLATTWPALDAWIAWSFKALSKGWHPTEDPWGEPLTKGVMAELAGKPLTKGHHRAIIWAIQGDQEFFSNVLKLPHWQNKFPCHECDAQKPMFKKKACPEGKSVKILKEENQQYEYISPQQAILAKRSSHPLFSVPGVSTAMVRGDSLHILYPRGVGSHLAGSILHYMCFYDWPKRQKVSPTTRLQKIFARVKELYSERKVSAKLTNLRLSMITDITKPHKAFPCLEAKAAETKHLLPCLEEVVKESLPEGVPIHHTMLDCLRAFNQISQHFDALGGFPTPSEFALAQNLAKRFFDQYDDLHAWALSKGRKLFHITHKFHTAHHLIRNAQHLNFRMHHNFRAEDFVGQVSVVGHSVSFGNAATRVCQKLTQKYLILLHLQLTRPGFGTVAEDDCDP